MPKGTRVATMLKKKAFAKKDVHWVESALDDIMIQDNVREYKKRTYFRPSSAHYCERCLWYMMMGYPQPPE